jgi:tRNA(Ile)-lysidine synthetase-like protein
MEINIDPGKYVIAVSGGVDSIVLLDLLNQNKKLELVIAHYDHGIRKDSTNDRMFVEETAKQYGLEFHHAEGKLGANASESLARTRRYEFLDGVKKETKSSSIITAHHQDDLIETAIINLLRGTNRRGLSSIYSKDILRPLLAHPKEDLVVYAKAHSLAWHEDSTNNDTKYLRNYIRKEIIPKLTTKQRDSLLGIIKDSQGSNIEMDNLLNDLIADNSKDGQISRNWFIGLPHNVAREVMSSLLREQGISFDKTAIENLVIASKTLASGKSRDIDKDHILKVQGDYLALLSTER